MYKILSFLLALTLLLGCSNQSGYNDPVPNHDTFTLESKHVKETRIINIWTPENYRESNTTYPVLYMPDGGVKEDFPHIANTLEKLIKDNKIEPVILVGIENTNRRRDLSGFSEVEDDAQYCPLEDGAKDFRAFITAELIPEINSKYRTTSKKGIIGESLAGLFIMETCMLTPDAFDFYIAMDPSLWWNNHYLEQHAGTYLNNFPNKPIKLWFAGSDAVDISQYTKALAKTLKTKAPSTLTWTYSDESKEHHHTIYRATKEKALVWALNKQ